MLCSCPVTHCLLIVCAYCVSFEDLQRAIPLQKNEVTLCDIVF